MKDKTYNRIAALVLTVLGVGGVFSSLVHAIPMYGALGMVPLIMSIGLLIIALDKDTD